MTHFRAQLRSVWRFRYLILLLALGAGLAAVPRGGTSWTATASLITVSQNRAPEQDGVLATGYVDLLQEPSFQDRLRQSTNVPSDVVITARTAAASPIIYVSATAKDRAVAEKSAADLAQAFLSEVNASLKASTDRSVSALRQAFAQAAPPTSIRDQVLAQLQDRINALNSDVTNQLQALELQSDATPTEPKTAQTVAVAVVGGLLLGIALAVGLGLMSRKLRTGYDLREKAGVEPMLELPPADKLKRGAERQDLLRQLAAAVALANLPRPAAVAVTTVGENGSTREIGRAIAFLRANQGIPSVFMHTESSWPGDIAELDPSHVVTGGFVVAPSSFPGLREVFPGGPLARASDVLGVEHVRGAVDTLAETAELVVIEAPPAGTAQGRMVCAAADTTILIVPEGTSAGDVLAARNGLHESAIRILGVVFVKRPSRRTLFHRGRGGRRPEGLWPSERPLPNLGPEPVPTAFPEPVPPAFPEPVPTAFPERGVIQLPERAATPLPEDGDAREDFAGLLSREVEDRPGEDVLTEDVEDVEEAPGKDGGDAGPDDDAVDDVVDDPEAGDTPKALSA